MNKLQVLITSKLAEGKSYRRIADEAGLNHVSISKYHSDKVTPDGKSLAKLAKYFNVDFWDLLEDVNEAGAVSAPAEIEAPIERRLPPEMRLIVDELKELSPTEQLEWLLRIRKEKEAQKLK